MTKKSQTTTKTETSGDIDEISVKIECKTTTKVDFEPVLRLMWVV